MTFCATTLPITPQGRSGPVKFGTKPVTGVCGGALAVLHMHRRSFAAHPSASFRGLDDDGALSLVILVTTLSTSRRPCAAPRPLISQPRWWAARMCPRMRAATARAVCCTALCLRCPVRRKQAGEHGHAQLRLQPLEGRAGRPCPAVNPLGTGLGSGVALPHPRQGSHVVRTPMPPLQLSQANQKM